MSGAYVVPASRVPDRLCSGCMTEADADPQIIADEFEAWVANGMPAGSQPPSFVRLGFGPNARICSPEPYYRIGLAIFGIDVWFDIGR
jgi:hypothetical protein